MGRIVIIGAGDFARELDVWIKLDEVFAGSDPVMFVSDHIPATSQVKDIEHRILGSFESFIPKFDDRLVLGIADPEMKRRTISKLGAGMENLVTFIHGSVIVAPDARIGLGSILCPRVIVSVGSNLGSCVTVNVHSTIGHDARIGAFSSLMSHVDVTGRCDVGEGVYMGTHASVLPGVVIEDGAKVGAGTVAIRRVKAGSTVFGVPGRLVSGQ